MPTYINDPETGWNSNTVFEVFGNGHIKKFVTSVHAVGYKFSYCYVFQPLKCMVQ